MYVLQNGKLLKVYGRFQEWVLHDPHKAARSYAEAIKRGLGDNMLNLTSEYRRCISPPLEPTGRLHHVPQA